MESRSMQFAPYIPRRGSAACRLARFSARLLQKHLLEYSEADRRSTCRFLEHVFGVKFRFTPKAFVVFRPPVSGPVAEEYRNEPEPAAKFRRDGYVGWQYGMDTFFNGWKASGSDELRMAVLSHEFAHVLFVQALLENSAPIFDSRPYSYATEGIAVFAEKECRRAYGYRTPLLKKIFRGLKNAAASLIGKINGPDTDKLGPPETENDDIYDAGFAFFIALKNKLGAKEAFRLLSSSLPRDMDEIYNPSIYTYRNLGEYC
jgi:hypothetical protein